MGRKVMIVTLGGSWAVVPEIYGFLAPEVFDFYKNHEKKREITEVREDLELPSPDEIWALTTGGEEGKMSSGKILRWWEKIGTPFVLKIWMARGTDTLSSQKECEIMTELIHRAVLKANEYAGGSENVILCLAGGRKTMSADLQQAGNIYGCRVLLHVVDKPPLPEQLGSKARPDEIAKPLDRDVVSRIHPLVVYGNEIRRSPVLDVKSGDRSPVSSRHFPLHDCESGGTTSVELEPDLFREIDRRIRESHQLLHNFIQGIVEKEHHLGFWSLYRLPPSVIERLREERLDLKNRDGLHLIQTLPKAELHCHIGGALDLKDQVKVGKNVLDEVGERLREKGRREIASIVEMVRKGERAEVWIPRLIDMESDVPRYIRVSAFLSGFEGEEEILENALFPPEWEFTGLIRRERGSSREGFRRYEMRGDLSGSKILQAESAFEKTAELIYMRMAREGVRYLELRVSPYKYTAEGLEEMDVMKLFYDTFKKLREDEERGVEIKFIITIGRGQSYLDNDRYDHLKKQVDLAVNLKERFGTFIAGIDLAGYESWDNIEDLSKSFRRAFEACLPITIHAGEIWREKERPIWNAIYPLHAERIGHGLSLKEEEEIKERIRDRGIALELCPSSNVQIAGFKDPDIPSTSGFEPYPLKDYLMGGLVVTINTDNPGISRTTLSKEYLKASRLTEGELTMWDALSLIKAGFQSAFLPAKEKEILLKEVDKEIFDKISERYIFKGRGAAPPSEFSINREKRRS